MQATQHTFAGTRMIVLDEYAADSMRPQLVLAVGLHEEPATVLEGVRPAHENAFEVGCGNGHVHGQVLNVARPLEDRIASLMTHAPAASFSAVRRTASASLP